MVQGTKPTPYRRPAALCLSHLQSCHARHVHEHTSRAQLPASPSSLLDSVDTRLDRDIPVAHLSTVSIHAHPFLYPHFLIVSPIFTTRLYCTRISSRDLQYYQSDVNLYPTILTRLATFEQPGDMAATAQSMQGQSLLHSRSM